MAPGHCILSCAACTVTAVSTFVLCPCVLSYLIASYRDISIAFRSLLCAAIIGLALPATASTILLLRRREIIVVVDVVAQCYLRDCVHVRRPRPLVPPSRQCGDVPLEKGRPTTTYQIAGIVECGVRILPQPACGSITGSTSKEEVQKTYVDVSKSCS